MLERKRAARGFGLIPGEGEDDIDLEQGQGFEGQEEGVERPQTLEDEVDNWDENAEDWDEDETTTNDTEAHSGKSVGEIPASDKKRVD